MKIKHNKKRNTAFVYEALIREATVAIVKQDNERKNKVFGVTTRVRLSAIIFFTEKAKKYFRYYP